MSRGGWVPCVVAALAGACSGSGGGEVDDGATEAAELGDGVGDEIADEEGASDVRDFARDDGGGGDVEIPEATPLPPACGNGGCFSGCRFRWFLVGVCIMLSLPRTASAGDTRGHDHPVRMGNCPRSDTRERGLGGDDNANGRFINVRLFYPCRYNHNDDKPIFKR